MVSRPRLRSFFTALCLHLTAALVIGYFGVHAYTGLFKQKYQALVVMNVQEKEKGAAKPAFRTSELVRYTYDKFILSRIVIIAFWVVIAGVILVPILANSKND